MKTLDKRTWEEMSKEVVSFFGRIPTFNNAGVNLTDERKLIECLGIATYLANEFPYVKHTERAIIIQGVYLIRFAKKQIIPK